MSVMVFCEYIDQNDMDEVLAGSPNCYVLPKKFNSLKDVSHTLER